MARTRARAAFILTVTSSMCLFVGWIIPFWFGRFYPPNSKKQWGLFYVIICEFGRCRNEDGAIGSRETGDPGAVDFAGGDNDIELLAIPVLATISFGCCLLGLFAVLVIHYHCCGRAYSYHGYVWMAAGAQFVAVTFVLSTVIVHAVALGAYFSTSSMESVIEFPWSLAFYALGGILLTASAILFTIITCRWQKHRHIYARKRYWVHRPERDRYSPRVDPPPDYNRHGGKSPGNHIKRANQNHGRISILEPPPDYMHVEFKTESKSADTEPFRDYKFNKYVGNDVNDTKRLLETNSTNGRRRNSAPYRDIVTDVISGDKWHVPWTYDWRADRDYGSDIYAGGNTYKMYLNANTADDDLYTRVIRTDSQANKRRRDKYGDEVLLKPKPFEYYFGRAANGRRPYDDYDAMRISRHQYGPVSGDRFGSERGQYYLYSPHKGHVKRSHTWYRT